MTETVSQGLRFLVMTGISAMLSLGVPFVLHEAFSVTPNMAVVVGLAFAFVANFLVSKYYVFHNKGRAGAQMARFALVSFLFRASEYVAFLVLHEGFGIQYMLALISMLATSLLLKFFVYKLFVFSRRREALPATGL